MDVSKIDTLKLRTEITQLCNDTKMRNCGVDHRGLNHQEYYDKMSEKYSFLFQSSQGLFLKCIDGTIDHERINQMLNMIDKVNNGKSYFEASKEIGQGLTDTYVAPLLKK